MTSFKAGGECSSVEVVHKDDLADAVVFLHAVVSFVHFAQLELHAPGGAHFARVKQRSVLCVHLLEELGFIFAGTSAKAAPNQCGPLHEKLGQVGVLNVGAAEVAVQQPARVQRQGV